MTIKTRLQITALIAILLALSIGSFIVFVNQGLNDVIEENRRADEIVRGVFELNILTNDYLLRRNERTSYQWWSRYNSISRLLIEVGVSDDSEKQARIGVLRENHKSISRTFFQLVTVLGRVPSEERFTPSIGLEDRLISQLVARSQTMVASASTLARENRQELTERQQQLNLFFLISIWMLTLLVVISSLLTMRSILKPIGVLQEGTKIVGTGNLDYKIGMEGRDEIGELSRAFDQMTKNLKASTSSRDELDAANKELEAFSYSVSHDLRAPLRSMDGFSQVLLQDYSNKLDADGQDYLRRVRAASQNMAQLIDDMLNLSRVTRKEMRQETVNLSAMAQDIASELQKTQPERQVKFIIAEGVVANGDSHLLRITLENLLSNAWKFTAKRPRATIEFGATQHDGKLGYFVRDDGAGFDMAYADKLFGAFQRLHARTEFPGTGIGLATVQRIVHRHGGRVWAEGAVEQGATFYFVL